EPAADLRVFAFVIFTHNAEIDLSGGEVLDGRFYSREQLYWANICILMELAANRNQKAPERNVVGDSWMAHGAEKNGIEWQELFEAVFGHHAAGLEICLTAPAK